jgi:hypothetical protein
MTNDQTPMFDVVPSGSSKKRSKGPVYQGVCAQIRRLTKPAEGEPLIDAKLWAGTIAQARSLADSIDRVDGREGAHAQANGVPLAQMHQQLDALMSRLNPAATDNNAVDNLVRMFQQEEERQRAHAAEAPHTED